MKINFTITKYCKKDLNIGEQYFIIVSLNLLQSHHVHPYTKACGFFRLVNVEPHQFKNHREQNWNDDQTP